MSSMILFPSLILSSPFALANTWNTIHLEDEFTGQKQEVTLVEDNQYAIALACGWGPRGSYYTPRVVFKSKLVNGGNPKPIAWKIDDKQGVRGNYWHLDSGFYGPNYGNEGQRMKDIADLLVNEMKTGNTILVSMDNKASSRLTLSGFAAKYDYVEKQCKDVYPKYDQYHTQRVFYKIN
ncbi:hypothetical protein [Vibrio sp. B1Z05]|uniref:hypothetical protein n=1 Tax=Vibrio sp. B1Z05 TaxID=2654980 RepID=UPI00128B1327|nr:hypothetical protein [Vibrio sp. B1Z05]MPW37297.1 hypothetical protein [Vibrio sp. B1Z05]